MNLINNNVLIVDIFCICKHALVIACSGSSVVVFDTSGMMVCSPQFVNVTVVDYDSEKSAQQLYTCKAQSSAFDVPKSQLFGNSSRFLR